MAEPGATRPDVVNLDALTDEVLVHRASRGSTLAWSVLGTRHYPDLAFRARCSNVPPGDADIVAGETLTQAWQARGTFDPERNFRAWLHTILRNKIRDWARAQKNERGGVPLQDATEYRIIKDQLPIAPPPTLEEEVGGAEEFDDERLAQAMAQLKPSDQEVLRAWSHLSGSDAWGTQSGTQRASLHRARRRLSAAYHALPDPEEIDTEPSRLRRGR